MTTFLKRLKAFRPLNLFIIAFTMVLVQCYLVQPILLDNFRIVTELQNWQLLLLVLATICITAAGYLVNDYFDVAIDVVNRPEKMTIGMWSERTMVYICLSLDIIGIALGYVVGYVTGNLHIGLLFVLVAATLMIYSRYLKQWPLVGNLTVAVLTALVLLLPLAVQPHLLYPTDEVTRLAVRYVWRAAVGYAAFAFMLTLIREVVKDIEDMQGDRLAGRRTLPIVLNENACRFIVIILLLILVRAILTIQQHYIVDGNYILPAYIAVGVQLPAIVAMIMAYRANTVRHYTQLSWLLKAMMLLGVCSMFIYKVIL